LVEVAIHVFHADMEFPGEWIKEDVEGWDKVGMSG
jgi:hypothetical protein